MKSKKVYKNDVCRILCINKERVDYVKKSLPSVDILQKLSDIFNILADPTRLKIVHALSTVKELCVCDIAQILNLSVSATSHQLRKLRDLRIVRYRNEGKIVYYSLENSIVKEYFARTIRQMKK